MSNEVIRSRTEADAIIAITQQAHSAPIIDTNPNLPGPVLVHRDGRIESLERLADNPRRKRAAVTLLDAESFIGYVKAYREPGTLLTGVCETFKGHFRAVLDYHEPEFPPAEMTGGAHWAEHAVDFPLTPTPEWAVWSASNGKSMSQEAFAEFLEDMASDIREPDAATLQEMVLTLAATKTVNFRSAKRLKDGTSQLSYNETVTEQAGQSGAMSIPDKFMITIQPFAGAPLQDLLARLRFRIDGGKLSFHYVLHRPDKMVRSVWTAEREKIETALGLPVHFGTAAAKNPTPA